MGPWHGWQRRTNNCRPGNVTSVTAIESRNLGTISWPYAIPKTIPVLLESVRRLFEFIATRANKNPPASAPNLYLPTCIAPFPYKQSCGDRSPGYDGVRESEKLGPQPLVHQQPRPLMEVKSVKTTLYLHTHKQRLSG